MLDELAYRVLCKKLMRGDVSCVSEIYDHYGDALYTVIYKIVKSEEVAAEILQDTFTKVWDKRATYNPENGRLYTWMMHVARNASINHINSKSFRQRKNIQSDENLVYLSDSSKAANSLETLDLKGAVNDLEDKYKVVINMIYYKGYTHKEVSEKLNIPLGTVKSRIKIGLTKLKKLYEFRFSSIAVGFTFLISILA